MVSQGKTAKTLGQESDFVRVSEALLAHIESSIQEVLDEFDADVDLAPEGGIEITFANKDQIVITRNLAAQEIWIAARAGGFHFHYQQSLWIDTRDGVELIERLQKLVSDTLGQTVELPRV